MTLENPKTTKRGYENTKKWRNNNRSRYNASQARIVRSIRRKLRQQVIESLGRKCVRCGFADWRALQIDHVYGGGVREIRQFKDNIRYLKHILKNCASGKYQLLCANCNWIKRYESEEVGHA